MITSMEFQDVVRRRRMVRRYADRPVARAVVDRMLDNAVRAPSAGFTQGWSFLVLDRTRDVERFWASTTSDDGGAPSGWLRGMRTAPLVIVAMTSKKAYLQRYAEPDKGGIPPDDQQWAVPYWYVDAGMASLLILQTAVDEGLGACFFGIPRDRVRVFRGEFGIPDAQQPVGAITVGHPADEPGVIGSPARRPRRHTDDVVHRGGW
jgi:nitroreductase